MHYILVWIMQLNIVKPSGSGKLLSSDWFPYSSIWTTSIIAQTISVECRENRAPPFLHKTGSSRHTWSSWKQSQHSPFSPCVYVNMLSFSKHYKLTITINTDILPHISSTHSDGVKLVRHNFTALCSHHVKSSHDLVLYKISCTWW